MLFWAAAGMTVSKFVCRNFSGHVRKAAGMFAALSWTPAQTGWVFCWLPLCDSCVTGPPQLAFYMCVCAHVCVCLYKNVSAHMYGLKLLCPFWMLSAPVQRRPFWSLTTDQLTSAFVRFWHRKGQAIWSWCRRNTRWWLAPTLVTSASITTSCFTALSMDCWAHARGSYLSRWVHQHVKPPKWYH